MLAALIYAGLEFTVLAGADRDGAEVVHLTIHSRDVGTDLGVEVVVPADDSGRTRGKPLLVFLHGHGGSDTSYTEDEAFFRALASLGRGRRSSPSRTAAKTATGTTAPTGDGAAT